MDYRQWMLTEAYARCSRLQESGIELFILSQDEVDYLKAYPGPDWVEWETKAVSYVWQPATWWQRLLQVFGRQIVAQAVTFTTGTDTRWKG